MAKNVTASIISSCRLLRLCYLLLLDRDGLWANNNKAEWKAGDDAKAAWGRAGASLNNHLHQSQCQGPVGWLNLETTEDRSGVFLSFLSLRSKITSSSSSS